MPSTNGPLFGQAKIIAFTDGYRSIGGNWQMNSEPSPSAD